MIWKSEYCDCLVDISKDELLKSCPIHEKPNEVLRHNRAINEAKGSRTTQQMRDLYFNKRLPPELRLAVQTFPNRLIDKLRRFFRR